MNNRILFFKTYRKVSAGMLIVWICVRHILVFKKSLMITYIFCFLADILYSMNHLIFRHLEKVSQQPVSGLVCCLATAAVVATVELNCIPIPWIWPLAQARRASEMTAGYFKRCWLRLEEPPGSTLGFFSSTFLFASYLFLDVVDSTQKSKFLKSISQKWLWNFWKFQKCLFLLTLDNDN